MATLAENVSAVNDCLTAINTAITTKGGTLQGGQKLRNAAAGIATIPTGTVDTRFKAFLENTLTTIDDSTVTYLSQGAIYDKSALTSIKLNGVTSCPSRNVIWMTANAGTNLRVLELKSLALTGAPTFYGLNALETLYVKSMKGLTGGPFNMISVGRAYALTDIYVSDDTAAELLANSNLPFLGNTNTDRYSLITFHCSDNDIKYVNGAWVEVQRSAT